MYVCHIYHLSVDVYVCVGVCVCMCVWYNLQTIITLNTSEGRIAVKLSDDG